MTAAAVVVVVIQQAVGAELHIAAPAPAARAGSAALTHLALVSGRLDRCKAQCSCLGPSSKPRLRGT